MLRLRVSVLGQGDHRRRVADAGHRALIDACGDFRRDSAVATTQIQYGFATGQQQPRDQLFSPLLLGLRVLCIIPGVPAVSIQRCLLFYTGAIQTDGLHR